MLVIEMQSYTIMRRLTGIRSAKCVVRLFRHRANVIECFFNTRHPDVY